MLLTSIYGRDSYLPLSWIVHLDFLIFNINAKFYQSRFFSPCTIITEKPRSGHWGQLLTLSNMGPQSHVEFLQQVTGQNEIEFSVNSLLSLIIVQRQCWEGNQVEIVLTWMFILICDIVNLVLIKQWYSCNFNRIFGKVWVVFYGPILHLAYSMLDISMHRG